MQQGMHETSSRSTLHKPLHFKLPSGSSGSPLISEAVLVDEALVPGHAIGTICGVES